MGRGRDAARAARPAGEGAPVWHAVSQAEATARLRSSPGGLTAAEARERLARWGPNRIEPPPPVSAWRILARQFASPLIYILVAAAVVALLLEEVADAGFIAAVLVVNALIGFVNEARAERRVRSLARLIRTHARVRRGGHVVDVDGEEIVPGDVLLLEPGSRVAADVRLLDAQALRCDESLLTGESAPVDKDAAAALEPETPLADRRTMAFAGTMVTSGRGAGLVAATGPRTEVGAVAGAMAGVDPQPPPLLLRMKRFAHAVGSVVLAVCGFLVLLGLVRREPLEEVFLGAVALAVSAVPEGLPIALTVALAVAVSRMASRRVVVRHLPAVEALGSCSVIATDKTGTLTHNQLTVERLVAGPAAFDVTGRGYVPAGDVLEDGRPAVAAERPAMFRLLRTACLANEGSLAADEAEPDGWTWSGDPTDVALLALAVKAGVDPDELRAAHPEVAAIPFEPERRYAASYLRRDGGGLVCVKGAPERVLEMCGAAHGGRGWDDRRPLDVEAATERTEDLMRQGYRVLALAEAETQRPPEPGESPPAPSDLVFLGLVAMTDPPREGVEEAVARCKEAGIRVVMITGDHAATAAAIASRIGLGTPDQPALEGREIAGLDDEGLRERIDAYAVVARATPADKLRVVRAWQERGAYVAVTGDGVNDAPALKQANLGVAMGRAGTDVAREAAELVITDDDFSSIVAGVEEGRVAYDNVRKVTYLLVSTGAGEVLLVLSAILLGLPVPLTAAQLLWLNLVTNGIQDVALAFEAREPGVLRRPPRPPRERIFNRLMLERTLLAGAVFGGLGLAFWAWLMGRGVPVEDARNLLVQLFVLFEIFHIGNARSETISLFRLDPRRNPVLLAGTLGALGVHLSALHIPFFQSLLGVAPIALSEWALLAGVAWVIVLVMELHKRSWAARTRAAAAGGRAATDVRRGAD